MSVKYRHGMPDRKYKMQTSQTIIVADIDFDILFWPAGVICFATWTIGWCEKSGGWQALWLRCVDIESAV